jgi:holo-[acyl-carrier protein] synthase
VAELEIYGIGVDLIEVNRIKSAIEKSPGFIKKTYTDSEVKYCSGKLQNAYISYAQRFAAKEAVSKSLRTGIGKNIHLNEIEVTNLHSGEPVINLYGMTKAYCDKLAIMDIKITLSGTEEHAIAFAIALIWKLKPESQ